MSTAPINSQVASNAPIPTGLAPVTAPILPDQGVLSQMSNFPPQTYNLDLGSSIVKLMSSLTGMSGGGQLRQRSLVDRLRSSMSSTYFTDLDSGPGAVLGISRQLGESLPFNPYTTAAPATGALSWLAMAEADATYRDRLFQVLQAVSTYGPSALGIKLIAESFLLAPVEVTEYYRGNPSSNITANPSLAYYITVTPHVAPTPQQTYGLMKILNKIKPAQATITLAPAPATDPYLPVPLGGAWATSFYWEVQSISSASSIYGSTTIPQYAFGSSQAASWTVNGWVSGVLSYANNPDGSLDTPSDFEQITWADGTITNYLPQYAMAPASETVLGTMVVPGNASANPLNPDNSTVSDLLLAGASVPAIQAASTITAQNVPQFWSTPERAYTDTTQEVIEVRFSSPVNVNAVSFQVANFPCTAILQVFDDIDQAWVNYYQQTVATSVPAVLPNPADALAAKTHPQHFGPGHWVPVAFRLTPTSFSRARIVMFRPGPAGPTGPYSVMTQGPAFYSLGVTEFSFDYVVDSASQLPDQGTVSLEPIGTSTDVAGNTITYSVYSEVPTVKSGALTQWRSFPQPVNNAVVCLYLDARDTNGNPQVIDRFFITPTHLGVGCTLYFAITEPDTPGDMSSLNWILLNRSYILMTGWMTVPPIAAKYWKFEMSGLVAEPLSNPFPVTADILLFGSNAINPTTGSAGYQGATPPGTATSYSLAAGQLIMNVPTVNPVAAGTYSPATALVAADPTLAQALQANFANYGYMDWQPFGAPPATLGGLEGYTTTTLASVNSVGFFCGFSSIVAYRSNPACPIDTPLYYEVFYDQSQIASSNCQTVGGIYSGSGTPPFEDNNPQSELLATPAMVTSKAYVSASAVNKVQFATSQSPPAEIVPFDTFHNGRYLPPPQGTYAWNDQQDWNIVGMGDVQVNFNAQTLTPTIVRGATAYTGPEANGIVSAQFLTSPMGYIAFAVRLSIVSVPPSDPEFFSQYPIYLQLCEWFGGGTAPRVLVEWPLSANTVGQTIEEHFSYQVGTAVGSSTFLCLAVAQHAGAYCPTGQTASYVVQAASGFDPSIKWEFSSDGSTWVNSASVNPIHNNRNGVVSIPNPSTDLYWRCTLYRPDMFVNLLKIRPWYQATDRPRQAPVMSGPNMSFSDPDQTIWTDPDFNTWALPVPPWWFARWQQTYLFADGLPVITPSSRIYTQDQVETVGPATDTAQVTYYRQMYSLVVNTTRASDVAAATALYRTQTTDRVGPASDSSSGVIITLTPYTDVYNYTGGAQTFTVPQNIQAGTVTFTVTGGGGGGPSGGVGATVTFTFPVTPGQVFNIYVGGQGQTMTGSGQGGYSYGYHEGGAPYYLNGNQLTYGQTGAWGTLGFGGASSAVATSGGTLVCEAGAGGGQGWLYGVTESSVNQVFNYSGGVQSWTLPATANNQITVTCTGGGGGTQPTSQPSGNPVPGGVGGVVEAVLSASAGNTLTVYVGGVGAGGGNGPGVANYAPFGYHEGGYPNDGGASGGSSSAVLLNGTLVMEAGAGGGSGGGGPNNYYYGGGYGGNPNGGAGVGSLGGGGATQSAGGTATGNSPGTVDGAPQSINGGNALSSGPCGGGGGGYAGGGAGWESSGNQFYGGGGGSSWAGNGASGISYGTASSVTAGQVVVTYISINPNAPTYNFAQAGGGGGAPNGGAGTGQAFGSASAAGGAGATQSAGGAGGAWTSTQPSGTTSGTAPAGSVGTAGVGSIDGGQAYPYAGGGGGGAGYTGGGAGAYAIYNAPGSWNENMWGGGGGGSSWAGNGATNISYEAAGSVGNGQVTASYNTSGPRVY
jgi:hypothetical protein